MDDLMTRWHRMHRPELHSEILCIECADWIEANCLTLDARGKVCLLYAMAFWGNLALAQSEDGIG